jgi:DNA-binding beta-propeller fold protein YncE
VAPDGSKVFVTGNSNGDGEESNYSTVAYDASTGATVWVRAYTGPGKQSDLPYVVAVSPDGSRVFVTGFSTGFGTERDYATLAYEA